MPNRISFLSGRKDGNPAPIFYDCHKCIHNDEETYFQCNHPRAYWVWSDNHFDPEKPTNPSAEDCLGFVAVNQVVGEMFEQIDQILED